MQYRIAITDTVPKLFLISIFEVTRFLWGGRDLGAADGLLTDHDERIVGCRPGSDVGLFQELLGQQGLLEAREQVAVLGGVGQRVCRLLVHLGQTLLPQLHNPGVPHTAKHAYRQTPTESLRRRLKRTRVRESKSQQAAIYIQHYY